VQAFFQLIRWPNLLIVALTLALLHFRLGGHFAGPIFWGLIITVVATAAAGYAVNDLYDQAIDRVNKPDQMVIGRLMSPTGATCAYLGLVTLALGAPMLLGLNFAQLLLKASFVANLLLWLYAGWFKKTPLLGNVLVAGLSAAPIWLLGQLYDQPPALIGLFSVFAFFISLIREIVKDLQDRVGDAQNGCFTLALLLGERGTKGVLSLLLLVYTVVLGRLLWHWPNGLYFFAAIATLLGGLAWRLYRAHTPGAYGLASRDCKGIMLVGMGGILLIG